MLPAGELNPDNVYTADNGLVEVTDTTAVIGTGTDMGPIHLGAQVVDSAPPEESAAWQSAGWESVTEVSLVSPDGRFASVSLAATEEGPLTVHVGAPGSYRLRIHAKGRDEGWRQEMPEEPVETHLIIFWPAPAAPVRMLRGADEVGQTMGRSVWTA